MLTWAASQYSDKGKAKFWSVLVQEVRIRLFCEGICRVLGWMYLQPDKGALYCMWLFTPDSNIMENHSLLFCAFYKQSLNLDIIKNWEKFQSRSESFRSPFLIHWRVVKHVWRALHNCASQQKTKVSHYIWTGPWSLTGGPNNSHQSECFSQQVKQ